MTREQEIETAVHALRIYEKGCVHDIWSRRSAASVVVDALAPIRAAEVAEARRAALEEGEARGIERAAKRAGDAWQSCLNGSQMAGRIRALSPAPDPTPPATTTPHPSAGRHTDWGLPQRREDCPRAAEAAARLVAGVARLREGLGRGLRAWAVEHCVVVTGKMRAEIIDAQIAALAARDGKGAG